MSTRRKFLEQASLLTTGSLMLTTLNKPAFTIFNDGMSPSDQVNVGVIGINGMGWSDLNAILKVPGVNLVALCDIDKNVLNKRLGELSKMNIDASKVKVFGEYRKMLELKEMDAVIIGTPDHWHCLQMVHACQAGKHVYVEKPVGNSIEECRIMVDAQKKYNRVVQAGQWQRSQQHFRDALDFLATGQLGNIRTVKAWCYLGWKQPPPQVKDSEPPAGVDYDMWLGPATKRPFNTNRFHFNFRWFWDYAGGLMTDWGVHLMDYALMGVNASVPKSISSLGGNFADPDSPQETPDTLCALYEFDKFNLVWDHAIGIENGLFRREHGIAFIGSNGTLALDRGGWEVFEEGRNPNKVSVPRKPSVDNGLQRHMENFVGVIRSGKMQELNCPIEAAAHVATVCQMGNIAFRSGKKIDWNKGAGRFTDGEVNKKYMAAPYHNGYQLPKP